jgi:hypothetical protein
LDEQDENDKRCEQPGCDEGELLGRAARARRDPATGGAGRAAAEGAVAEEVGEELVEEAPAAERRPACAAALTLKLPQVLFADSDRLLLAVLPDPHACDGGPTPVDLAHRGRHENLLAAGTPAREGLVHGGTRRVEKRVPGNVPRFVATQTIRKHTPTAPAWRLPAETAYEPRPSTWVVDLQVIRPDPYVEQKGRGG